jgi:hypothetical protein
MKEERKDTANLICPSRGASIGKNSNFFEVLKEAMA